MTRPRALDLFCGAGGAGMGLHLAGFDVVGVDIAPQPRYPFEFHQADAMTFPLDGFDFVWASPPCQAHTSMKTMHNAKSHPDLIPATRRRLMSQPAPWVIENVPGAPLARGSVMLCGTMFNLGTDDAELRRHRWFETSIPLMAPECRHGSRRVIGVYGGHLRNRKRTRTSGIYGEGCRDSRRKFDKGQPDFGVEEGRKAMGIDWMTLAELCQAIPPAYSRWLAEQIIPLARCGWFTTRCDRCDGTITSQLDHRSIQQGLGGDRLLCGGCAPRIGTTLMLTPTGRGRASS